MLFRSQREQSQGQETQIDDAQIRKDVWTEMYESILLKQEAKKAGIVVTKGEVLDILIDNPPDYLRKAFTDSTGNFNRRAYLEIITNPDVIFDRLPQSMQQAEKKQIVDQYRKDLITIEELIKDQILQNSMTSLVTTATSPISTLHAINKYKADSSVANVEFIIFETRKISDSAVKVSDDEILKYYNDNKTLFEPQKEKRKILFVAFPIVPSEKDTANANKIVNKITRDLEEAITPEAKDSVFSKLLRDHQGETHDYTFITDIDSKKATYISPLSVRGIIGPVAGPDGSYFFRLDGKQTGTNVAVDASHILVKFNDNKDSAKAEALKILSEAKKGEDFATLAIKYSEDKGSARQGGSVGFFTKGQMVKPFEDAAFAASVGSIVGPVESQFGYHIIKVNDKKSEEIKYSEIRITPEISRITRKAIARNANELKLRVDQGENFDSAAKSYNLTPREMPPFEMTKPILGSLYLTAQAFANEVGATIGPLELERQGLVVAYVIGKSEAGVPSFEDKKDEIKNKLVNIKKLDAIKPKAEDAFKRLRALPDLSLVSNIDNTLEVKTIEDLKNNGAVRGVGRDFAFTSKVFVSPLNQITGPIRGERGYYILLVKDRNVQIGRASCRERV